MGLGTDQQYDLSWEEQDKIRRRLEIKNRLKLEGIKKRYTPFFFRDKVLFNDPSLDRYMDLRKKGRVPGAPWSPKIFFTLIGVIVVPVTICKFIVDWERRDWLVKVESGEIPYEERMGKALK